MQRVSNFYNTIRKKINVYQRTMLQQPATEFKQLVKSLKNLSSKNTAKIFKDLQYSLSQIMKKINC
jgi:ribosomal protein L18E